MTGFVKLILEASFTAGLAALAVMLIRLAMKKAPKRWAYALWAVVFFRCLCPFTAESAVSLFNVIPERAPEVLETAETSAIVSEINNRPAVMEQVETELQSYGYTPYPVPVSIEPVKEAPETAKKPVNKSFIFFAVWAAGALAMALYGVISYILLMRKLRTAVKTEDGVYESDLISTAFSAGFFPPKIYVPCGLFEEERKLIIAHERVHIRRLDYIVKPVAFIALTVHWFNPLIWLAFSLMTRDMELSCDEAVLKIFGAGEKKAYSEALLRVSMKRSGLVDNYKFMPLAFAETGIKGRVKNVLKYKKPTVVVTVLAAAVVIAACAALGPNAKSKAEDMDEISGYTQIQNGETAVLLAGGEEISFELGAPNVFDIILDSGKNVSVPANHADTDSDGKKVLKIYDILYGEEIVDGEVGTLSMGAGKRDYEMWYVGIKQAKIDKVFFETIDDLPYINIEMTITPENEEEAKKLKSVIELDSRNRQEITCSYEESGEDLICKFSMYTCDVIGCERHFAIALDGFDGVPVYINSDIIKAAEKMYVPLAEGTTSYTLAYTVNQVYVGGEKVSVTHKPDEHLDIYSPDERIYGIQYNPSYNGSDSAQTIWLGMQAKNHELDRQLCMDLANKKITDFAIEDFQVTPSQFTAVMRITFAEGEEISISDLDDPIRMVKGDNENEYLLYMTADYDRENVDSYALDLYGFEDVTAKINAKFNVAEEETAEYTRVSGGWAEFTLETGETGYAAYDVNDIPVIVNDWTFSVRGKKDRGVSIGCFKTIDDGVSAADYCDVLDFGDNSVTAVTVENMYTEKSGSNVKLYTEIKVACPESDGLMNNMALNDGDCEIAIAKLINGEYLFTVVKEYDAADIVIDGFAVVVSGFETPYRTNTDYEVPVYVNSALDPVKMPEIVTYDTYKQIYVGEDMQPVYVSINYNGNLSDEEKARIDEEFIRQYMEGLRKQRQEEEQRILAEEAEEKYNASVTASYTALQYPVDGVITSGYGDGRGHKGVDFYAEKGTEICAAADGTVSKTGSGWNGGYGNSITIDHGSGIETVYAHLSDITVEEGDKVAKGDHIGHAGSTGDTTGNELHFEIWVNGKHVDPVNYIALQERGTVSATYHDMSETLILNKNGTFLVENYISSYIPSERPEKEYKFENGILSLEFVNGSVQCFEAVGNDLVYRKDLSNYIYSIDVPQVSSKTLELIAGTSLNGGRIEMEPLKLNGKYYYLVSNETQLRAIGGTLYGLDLNYIQQCDIELSPDEW